MTLRGGAAVDDYHTQPPFDPVIDVPTAEYLEKYHWGIPHLDAASWHYYVPIFIDHSLRNLAVGTSNAVETFLASLRPPDREPSRFASLADEHEQAIVAMLDQLAFDDKSKWKPQAILALEEYWAPGALYRNPRDELLIEIRRVYPIREMPSKRDLRFHPDGCLQCEFISQYLDEHRGGTIDSAVIRYTNNEMTCLSAKGWSWVLPHYLPYCLTAEAEYNQTETEFLIYNLGPKEEFEKETRERLSDLSKPQITCLKHFLHWLSIHPHWSTYCPEDIARATQFLQVVEDEDHE
jgi:uncharacterized protein DUF6714